MTEQTQITDSLMEEIKAVQDSHRIMCSKLESLKPVTPDMVRVQMEAVHQLRKDSEGLIFIELAYKILQMDVKEKP